MSDIVISAEGLGKCYRLRHQRQPGYVALRDVLAEKARSVVRSLSGRGRAPNGAGDEEEFWALRDVSFEVRRQEVVGIIGRNGAGKSTLLKILSRITEPSAGRVRIRGRVASLLEVGTGFHPELTGRENIFLNGAILGMTRAETRRKFDEIVAFAEVERFLDTPVKRYSSGMYVRLAFAVAAHLEPEILIVDEVLAVGDAAFQRKCMGKMRDVSHSGRTVLFVSHNMAAVQALCGRGVLLDRGAVVLDGTAGEAVKHYLESVPMVIGADARRMLGSALSLVRIDCGVQVVPQHGSLSFHLEFEASADELISDLALLVHASGGERVALIDLRSKDGPFRLVAGARLTLRVDVPEVPFVENDFAVGLYVNADTVCNSFMDLVTFSVIPADSGTGIVPRDAQFRGLVELRARVHSEIAGRVDAGSSHATIVDA